MPDDSLWYLIIMGGFGLVLVFVGCSIVPMISFLCKWRYPPLSDEEQLQRLDAKDHKLQSFFQLIEKQAVHVSDIDLNPVSRRVGDPSTRVDDNIIDDNDPSHSSNKDPSILVTSTNKSKTFKNKFRSSKSSKKNRSVKDLFCTTVVSAFDDTNKTSGMDDADVNKTSTTPVKESTRKDDSGDDDEYDVEAATDAATDEQESKTKEETTNSHSCAICLEEYHNANDEEEEEEQQQVIRASGGCSHYFHKNCMKSLIRSRARKNVYEVVPCPICRMPFFVQRSWNLQVSTGTADRSGNHRNHHHERTMVGVGTNSRMSTISSDSETTTFNTEHASSVVPESSSASDVPSIPRPPASALDGSESDLKFPINHLLRATVVVALWDGKTRRVVRCGSGFIADKKRGLIVTASHTLMNIWGDKSTPFGEDYDGLREGKALIGVITKSKSEESSTEAVFRYFAKIVSKDPNIEKGVCHLDACVLRITTRMEHDASTRIAECAELPERLLLGNTHAMKQEGLAQLKLTNRCELDEQVRIFGYNQGGEGVLAPGEALNRYVDFARGYVCGKFAVGVFNDSLRHCFKPREEIVVLCPTIGGHSGGPCVNRQGEVIGILSRADPAENQRCYLVPTYEWKALLKEAKRKG